MCTKRLQLNVTAPLSAECFHLFRLPYRAFSIEIWYSWKRRHVRILQSITTWHWPYGWLTHLIWIRWTARKIVSVFGHHASTCHVRLCLESHENEFGSTKGWELLYLYWSRMSQSMKKAAKSDFSRLNKFKNSVSNFGKLLAQLVNKCHDLGVKKPILHSAMTTHSLTKCQSNMQI